MYNTAEIADGTVSFVFSCFLVCFVLLCSVSRLVNDNKYPVQNCNENTTNHNTNKVPKLNLENMMVYMIDPS